MTTTTTEPLHHALLEQAHADAARIHARAEERAAHIEAAADDKARSMLANARAAGAAAASLEGGRRQAAARRSAHARVLGAQRQIWDELRASACAAVRAAADEALFERLASTAREQLGNDAVLERDRAGGLRASAGAKRVDYTLEALVDRCLARLGSAVTEAWR